MVSKSPKPRGKGNAFTPERRALFLEKLADSDTVVGAARATGISSHCAYDWRNKDEDFRAGWIAATGKEIVLEPRRINPGGHGSRLAMVARRHDAPSEMQLAEFIAHLAMTSNVSESAREAGLHKKTVYRLYGRDRAFARRWSEALAQGYEHLEMEMLARARFGTDSPVFHAGEKIGQVTHYTDATALKLMITHKDAVARQRAYELGIDEDDVLRRLDAKLAEMTERRGAAAQGESHHGD